MDPNTIARCARTIVLAAVFIGGGLHTASPVAAQEGSLPWKTAGFQGGLYQAYQDGRVRGDSATLGTGTVIDLEDDLGLNEDITTYRLDAFWRVYDRFRIDISFHSLRRLNTRTLNRALQFGDVAFPAGTLIDAVAEVDLYEAAVSYSFLVNDRIDLAVSGGVYVGDITVDITSAVGDEDADYYAPLPVLGLRGSYAINDVLFLRGQVHVSYFDFGDTPRGLADVLVGIDYDITRNLGVGVGYNYTDINIEAEDDGAPVDIDNTFGAFMLYGRIFF